MITAKQDAITRIDLQGFSADWKQDILFLSDIHKDSPYCDDKLLKAHLDEAVKRNAFIIIAGDLFDSMQGVNDPRRSYKELKASLKGIDYFDRVLDEAVEFFRPYAGNLAMLGYGNHEYSIVRHNGTDLVQRFVGAMRSIGSPIVTGGYGGFIRISVYQDLATPRDSYRIWYNHGSGGESSQTKGIPQAMRQAQYVQGVNCVWNGHNHQDYISSQAVLTLNNKDNVERKLVTFIRTPGYKLGYADDRHGYNGYEVMKMMAPASRGCVWGELRAEGKRITAKYVQDVRA